MSTYHEIDSLEKAEDLHLYDIMIDGMLKMQWRPWMVGDQMVENCVYKWHAMGVQKHLHTDADAEGLAQGQGQDPVPVGGVVGRGPDLDLVHVPDLAGVTPVPGRAVEARVVVAVGLQMNSATPNHQNIKRKKMEWMSLAMGSKRRQNLVRGRHLVQNPGLAPGHIPGQDQDLLSNGAGHYWLIWRCMAHYSLSLHGSVDPWWQEPYCTCPVCSCCWPKIGQVLTVFP